METLKLKDGIEFNFGEIKAKTADGKHLKKADSIAKLWRNRGYTEDGDFIPWSSVADTLLARDTVTSGEVRALLTTATETVMREPIEPILVVTSLFNTVQAKGLRTEIITGSMGAVEAGEYDEGGTPPEVSFDIGGGMQVATIGKSGLQASFTDEALRYSSWDLMAIYIRKMGAAMARHTERRALDVLLNLGNVLIDNTRPTTSLLGTTTGLDHTGAKNGSLGVDDLMEAYLHTLETGYPCDTIIMHPAMYLMFQRDAVLRHLFLQGNSNVFWGSYNGNVAPLPGWSNGMIGAGGVSNAWAGVGLGAANGTSPTPASGMSNRATSAPVIPSIMGVSFNIIVSPLIPFDHTNKACDLIFTSSGMVGNHYIDEGITSVEWRDQDREMVKLRFKQRDSFAINWEGAGVNVLRGVRAVQNFYHGDVTITKSIDDLAIVPDRTTAI